MVGPTPRSLRALNNPTRRAKKPAAESSDYSVATVKHQKRIGGEWKSFVTHNAQKAESALRTEEGFKEFLEHYADHCERTHIHGSLPTVDTMKNVWNLLVSWLKTQHHEVDPKVIKAVGLYVKNSLDLPDIHRTRQIVFDSDLKRLRFHLWARDEHDFRHEVSRVQLGLMLNLCSASGSRVGEHIESTPYSGLNEVLLYKDTSICIINKEDMIEPDVRVEIRRRSAKGSHMNVSQRCHKNIGEEKSSELNGYTLRQSPLLANNCVLMFLALALARGVLKGISTVDELLAYRPSERCNQSVRLPYNGTALELPVFHRGGSPQLALSSSTFGEWLPGLSSRAGYSEPIGVHAIRRGVVNTMARSGVPATLRNHLLGHTENVFEQNYRARLNTLDAQAWYENRPASDGMYNDCLGMDQYWSQDLPRHLGPIGSLEATLVEELQSIDEARAAAHPKERNRFDKMKARLREKQLRIAQRNHISERTTRDIELQLAGNTETASSEAATKFDIIKRFLPDRAKLATGLFQQSTIYGQEGRQALKALVCLCGTNGDVLYLPNERPKDGRCPECSQEMQKLSKVQRAKHIHSCVQRKHNSRDVEIESTWETRRSRFSHAHPFAKYCWICYEWFLQEKDWLSHLRQHLQDKDMPNYYGQVTFRYTLLKPSFCPFCYSSKRQTLEGRFFMLERPSALMRHVEAHLEELEFGSDPVECPVLACNEHVDARKDMVRHLAQFHGITDPHNNGVTMKRRLQEKAQKDTQENKRARLDDSGEL